MWWRLGGRAGVLWAAAAAAAAAAGVAVMVAEAEALAQVNAETLQQNLFKPGVGAFLSSTITLAQGNVELVDVGATGRLQYQTLYPPAEGAAGEGTPPYLRHRVLVQGNGHYADSQGHPFLSQSYLHTRWTAMWHPRVGSEIFAQHQYNRFFRLERRSLLGAGVRVEIVHTEPFLWWGGSGYMLEYEKINVQPGAPDQRETVNHRWTTYVTERVSFGGGRLIVQSTTYLQPRFDDFSDFRVLEELETSGRLNDLLSYGLMLSVLYDSDPPTGVQSTDVRMSSNVRLTY